MNSADAYRAQGRQDDALRALETAKQRAPGSAPVAYALGLALSRKGQADAALAELERAARSRPTTRSTRTRRRSLCTRWAAAPRRSAACSSS